jgi:hypothetical protein
MSASRAPGTDELAVRAEPAGAAGAAAAADLDGAAAVDPAGTVDAPAPARRRAPVVRWERLRLQGFGRHRDLRIDFPPGIAVWVAPNEAGKSTAVLGLVATVWGLPHLNDPSGFSWGRFRGFDGGPHHGEVTLACDGERYTIVRELDTHRVRVVHHAADGDAVVVDADHNPNARREVSPYAPWLATHLGLTDAGLVLATFVVAQGDLGGPAHELGHDVQSLVAGAGGGTWRGAQARLEGDLRATTRWVKGLAPGLTRDGRQDQALERSEARVAELEAALAAGRVEAEAFIAAQAAVAAADERARDAAAEARALRASADAQRAWVERREVAMRALRRAAELERAGVEARALADELAAAQQRAAATHPELDGVAEAGLEERVAAWSAAVAAESAQRDRLAAAEEARGAALSGAHDAVAAALDEERALSDGSPAAAATEPLAPVVAAAEAAARRWRDALAILRRERGLADAAAAELVPLAPLAGLAAYDRVDLSGYREQVAAWAGRLHEAETALEAWRAGLEDAQERYGEVAGLDSEAAADLIAFARAEERPEPLAAWRWAGAAVLAVVVAAVVGAVGWNAWLWGLAAGGAWALVWPRRPTLRSARRRLDARVAAGETVLAGDDERRVELARRREAYLAHRRELRQLESGERAAARRLAEVDGGAAAFRSRWTPLRDALIAAGHDRDVDLGEAHARYERAASALAEAETRATAACRALGVPDATAVAPDAPAVGAGPDAVRAAAWGRRQGALEADASVAQLEGWLARLGPTTWAAWRAAADQADARSLRRDRAREARRRAEEDAVRVAIEHERAVLREERALAAARAGLGAARAAALEGARLEADDATPAALRLAWRQRAAAHHRAAALGGRLDAHLRAVAATDVAGLSAAVEAAGWEASDAVRAWRALVIEHPSLPAVEFDRDAVAAGLQGAGDPTATFAATRARAEAAAEEARAAERTARAAHEALARAQGSDPIDVAAAEVDLAAARDEVVRLRFERDALALAASELAAAVEVYRATHLRRLEATAGARMAAFAATPGRRVRLDDGFRALAVEADGRALTAAQLSQGARDQLALALRWAIADLMADDVALPLVLDDPFLNWDDHRTARVAEALRTIASEGRQVWLLSHRAELGDWGAPVAVTGG